ncbi:MAG: translocation/assembly module TamB domain-containing protein [Paludibacteraceae bacterium]|nr:translocation/assembly module TamB domain-containing protein [Paludibacteraceae bacterium]
MKRLLVIVGVTLLCLLGTGTALVLALRSARVQTAAVQLMTGELSRALHVKAHIGKVNIRPPLALSLDSVFLSDQHSDTLLYVPSINVRFNPFVLKQKRLSFPLVQLDQPFIRIVRDSTGTNMDFLANAFRNDQPRDSFTYAIDCRRIAIRDAQIRYIDRTNGTDVQISDIRTDLGLHYAGRDDITAQLQTLHIRAQAQPYRGWLQADLHGSLDTLYADRLVVSYLDRTIIQADLQATHLLQPDSLYIVAQCSDLSANTALLSSIIGDFTHRPVTLPAALDVLGDMHYTGTLEGGKDSIYLRGALSTRAGTLTTDAYIRQLQHIHGALSTRNLALGRLTHNARLGRLMADVQVDASIDSSNPFAQIDGTFSVHNSYLRTTVRGHIDADSSLISARANIDAPLIDLAGLQLTDSLLNHQASFTANLRLQADPKAPVIVDAMRGQLSIDSLRLSGAGQQVLVPHASLKAESDNQYRSLSLTSPLANAAVQGNFNWSTLPATICSFAHRNLPSLVQEPAGEHQANDMDFFIDLPNPDLLADLIRPNTIAIPQSPDIYGYIHESDSAYSLLVQLPQITKGNTAYQDILLRLDNLNPSRQISARLSAQQHPVVRDSVRLKVKDFSALVQLNAIHDTLRAGIELSDADAADGVPDIYLETSFAQYNQRWAAQMHILPASFSLGSEQWTIGDAQLHYTAADTTLRIDMLQVNSQHQLLQADGALSARDDDSLTIRLQDIDLDYLLSVTRVPDAIDLQGQISGWATLYSAFSTPRFQANLTIPHGTINGASLGQVDAAATFDPTTHNIVIDGQSVRNDSTILQVTGLVVPGKPASWELNMDANGAPLELINYWTSGIVEDIHGSGFGAIRVGGHNHQTIVTADIYARNASLVIPYTGCRYFFSDSLRMDSTSISFPHVQIHDAEGNKAMVTGQITHRNFTDMQYLIDVQCTNLLALDMRANAQRSYYGRVYADGNVHIAGQPRQARIDVNATATGNTDFYFSLATASDASESDFITFNALEQSITAISTADDSLKTAQADELPSHFLLNIAVEVTPTSRVHLVLDPHNGDGIVGRGDGNLRFSMDASTGEAQLVGTYTLRSGTFSYSVGNLVHRDFSIDEGSVITWLGDPAQPQMDVTARYRCTASLRDLFGADTKSVTSRTSIPVECTVHITGTLQDAEMAFGIEFPQSEESVAAQINAVINTEAMLMRQVVYLLVFNRFFTPEYLRTATSATGINDAYALLSSTVTGQINAWLSRLTSMVNVGFNLRSDIESGQQAYETEANIQIQPIDRLTINGNVGYRYNDLTNQPIFGDADIEYELTPDGKFRAKAFTHSVDKYSLHQSGMQEGVGFIFRHDFNRGDAKKRREQREQNKQQTINKQ